MIRLVLEAMILKPVAVLCALCALAFPAKGGEASSPPYSALDLPVPAPAAAHPNSVGAENSAASGGAVPSAEGQGAPSGIHVTLGDVNVSVHMMGGAGVGGTIGR